MVIRNVNWLILVVVLLSLASLAATSEAESNPTDVTDRLELVGNPSRDGPCKPDDKNTYARNPWDLQVFEDNLYIGSGNSSNTDPGSNAGPVWICVYDPQTGEFQAEYQLPEEQIETFREFNGDLYIPGHDPVKNGTLRVYVKSHQTQAWSELSTVSLLHAYDYLQDERGQYLAIGGQGFIGYRWGDTGSWQKNPTFTFPIVVLNPDGSVEIDQVGCCWRTYRLFTVGGHVYGSTAGGFIVKFDDHAVLSEPFSNGLPPSSFIPDLPAAPANSSTPGYYEEWYGFTIRRDVTLGQQLVYVVGTAVNDHQWLPHGLYTASSETNARRIDLGDNREPWDLLVHNDTAYVLTAIPTDPAAANKTYHTVSVMQSADLETWTELLRFNVDPASPNSQPFAQTFARSFEIDGNDMYFGLGTNVTPLAPHTGNIVRVRNALAPTPMPVPPSLSIPSAIETTSGNTVTVPIVYQGSNNGVVSTQFSLDYDADCLSFSAMDGNGDGIPDAVDISSLADVAVTFDSSDTNGELDFVVGGPVPPYEEFQQGILGDVTFSAVCIPPSGAPATAAVQFSSDPPPFFLAADSLDVAGETTGGWVQVANDVAAGDANGDSAVDAGDIAALVLELFDGDGSLWLDASSGTFAGTPVGSDANQDTQIDAADLSCLVLIILGDGCTVGASASAPSNSAVLSIPTDLYGMPGDTVVVPVQLDTGGNIATAAIFAVDLPSPWLQLDLTDANKDGLPDAIEVHVPPEFEIVATYNEADQQVQIAIFDATLPLARLPDGPIVSLTLSIGADAQPAVLPVPFATDRQSSLGSSRGSRIPLETVPGRLVTGLVSSEPDGLWLFLPQLQR